MYGGYGYYGLGYSLFDPTMILVYIGALLSMWASSKAVPGHLRCDSPAGAGTAY